VGSKAVQSKHESICDFGNNHLVPLMVKKSSNSNKNIEKQTSHPITHLGLVSEEFFLRYLSRGTNQLLEKRRAHECCGIEVLLRGPAEGLLTAAFWAEGSERVRHDFLEKRSVS